jgi:hypothetical protein
MERMASFAFNRNFVVAGLLWIVPKLLESGRQELDWRSNSGDPRQSGRAEYSIPANSGR